MNFWLRLLQTFLDKWYFPTISALIVAFLTGVRIRTPKEFIKKTVLPVFFAILIPTSILTMLEDEPDPKKDVFIRNTNYGWSEMNSGLASLYDYKTMPFWFKSYLEDEDKLTVTFEIDNIGKTYANIVGTKLIVDDYKPVAMNDILLFRGKVRSGVPDTVSASVDMSNIREGFSEYDVNFTIYNVNSDGTFNREEGYNLNKGESFYVEQSSRIRLNTSLIVNKSGIYTCHLLVNYEYYGEMETMETSPASFIYLENNEKDYVFNKEKLDAFHLELKSDAGNRALYYDIDGRTLRFHDSETIFRDTHYQDFYKLIHTIIIEDGTKELEAGAFWNVGMMTDVTTMYLPRSLERFDLSFFDVGKNLKRIYFGGTEEQWVSMVNNSENDRTDILDGVDIVYDYGPMPTKEEELQKHQSMGSYYELYHQQEMP